MASNNKINKQNNNNNNNKNNNNNSIKGVSKPPKIAKAAKTVGDKYLSRLGAQVLNPLSMNGAIISPSEFPITGDAKIFKRTVTLKASEIGGAGANFSIRVAPHFTDTLRMTHNAGIPAAMTASLIYRQTRGATIQDNDGDYPLNGLTEVYDSSGTVLGSGESSVVEGKLCIPIQAGSTGASTSFDVTVLGTGKYILEVNWTIPNTGWATVASGFLPTLGAADHSVAVSAGNNILGLRVAFATPTGAGVVVNFAAFTGLSYMVPSEGNYNLFKSESVSLAQVERSRVTAMSVLAKFAGNDLNNGGAIAAARVQPGFSSQGNMFNAIAKQVDHAMVGDVKDGAYAWWLPGSYKELEFTSERHEGDATELVIGGDFADAGGMLQITFALVVEFYSPLQIFDHRIGPASTDRSMALYHDLNLLPAATCNPEHLNLVEHFQQAAKAAGAQMIDYAVNHPAEIASAISMGLAML